MLSLKETTFPESGTLGSRDSSAKELGALFVAALTQEDETSVSLSAWSQLLSYLEDTLSSSQVDQLAKLPETQHYVHRMIRHVLKHDNSSGHMEIMGRLSKLFPGLVDHLKDEELPFSYSYSNLTPPKKHEHKRAATTDSVGTATLFSYSPAELPATFRGPPVQLSDLLPAANKVSSEFSSLQKNLAHAYPVLPQTRHSTRDMLVPPRRQRSHHRSRSTPTPALPQDSIQSFLVPVAAAELQDEHFSRANKTSLFPKKKVSSPVKTVEDGLSVSPTDKMRNAFDVIEAFATGQLKSESESIYLNYTNSDRWDPYSLTIVPKTKVQPEHFVISKFGILRVYPDETSDFQSFADWLREAALYKMLRKIPFLKKYLIQNAFKQWYGNVRFAQYVKVHTQVSRVAIRFLPDFTDALLKIRCLSEELLTVPFHHLAPQSCYDQDSMEHSLQGSQLKAQRFLIKYFKYCRRIVTEVVKSTHSRVIDFETDKRHKPFVSDLPLSVQTEKLLRLERDLKAAKLQESKLANFVGLAERTIYACLLALSRQEAMSWIATVITDHDDSDRASLATPGYGSTVSSQQIESTLGNESEHLSRASLNFNAFLSASFDFSEAGKLCILPSHSDLQALIVGPLQKLCSILSAVVSPLIKPSPTQWPETSDTHQPVDRNTANQKQQDQSTVRAAPPSMAPSRQPKSLLTVLKGISAPHNPKDMVTPSERARSELSQVTVGGVTERDNTLSRLHSPLDSTTFIQTIETDEEFSSCVNTVKAAVDQVSVELDGMCTQYSWLNQVWHFITHWEGRDRAADMTAEEYEATLSQLCEWVQLVAELPSRQLTSHSLLTVSSSTVLGKVQPQLIAIWDQLISAGMQRAISLCVKVLEDIRLRVDVLSAKRYDLEGFAEYAHQLRECQSFDKSEADNIGYVLLVHSALIRHGVEVPADDKAFSKKLQTAWQAFRDKLKEAEAFVAAQTPMKAQGLQESIEACVEDLSNLVSQVNQGEFINPDADPDTLLDELKVIQEQLVAVRSRLLGLSKWKEAITGELHDLSGVGSLMDQQYVRQELWKYRRVFDTYEKQWMKVPFKKLDTNLVSQKVSDWLEACAKLERILPSNDPVLATWKERLRQFKDRTPLLQQLSSKALRTSHWYTIFASLGEDYNPDTPYTLVDFDLYKIYDHSDIIFEICHDAMQQEKLRAKVDQLQAFLEQKVIPITQFPIEHYPFAVPVHSTDSTPRKPLTPPRKLSHVALAASAAVTLNPTKPTVTGTPSKPAFSVGFQGLTKDPITKDCLFAIEQQTQLCVWLESDLIQTKVLLSSPHLGSLKVRGEQLLKTLTELQEIFMMLSQCQDKWWELLSLFSQLDSELCKETGLSELQQATTKYQEIALSIRDDPRLLSLLGKRRGQKGFRELQGEQLRHRIQEVDSLLEIVVHKINGHLKDSCKQFPRLCFLSDKEVLRVLSNNGSPLAIMSLIQKVFPAVRSMQLTEILPSQSSTSIRKLAANIDEGLQLVAVEGWQGELVTLSAPLPLGRRSAPLWLNALEGALSYSVASSLTDCLATLPDCLLGASGSAPATGDPAVACWISTNLGQCIQLSLELSLTSAIHSALLSEEPLVELQRTRTKLSNTIELISEMVRSIGQDSGMMSLKRSSLTVLQSLVLTLTHKRSIVKASLDSNCVSLSQFNWRYRTLYSTEVDNLYRDNSKSVKEQLSSPSLASTTISRLTSIPGKASLSHRLQTSSHSLVASSKSLLASKNLLGNTRAANELQKSGASSMVLTTEAGSNRCSVPTKCMVHCGQTVTPYGFEYLSSDSRLVMTPETEACVLAVINSFAGFNSCSLHGGPVSGRRETGKEIAKVVGRHSYQFCCSPGTTLTSLHRALIGAMQTGSVLLLDSFENLPLKTLTLLGEWLQQITLLFSKAFKGKQSSIILSEQEDVQSEMVSESTSTLGPLPVPSLDHHQSFKVTSNQSFVPQPPSVKTLTSHHSSGEALPERTSSSLSHQHLPTQSFVAAVLSTNKTSTPVPSSQRSFRQLSPTSGRTTRATTRMDWYKMMEGEVEWFGYGGGTKEEVEFSGDVLFVSPAFGCLLIGPACVQSNPEIPEQLKVALRSVGVMLPDLSWISRVLLLSNGFKSAHSLSKSLATFWQNLRYQISSDMSPPPSAFNLHAMKLIIDYAASIFHNQACSSETPLSETEILVHSIRRFLLPQTTHPQEVQQREETGEAVSETCDLGAWTKMNQLLELHFPTVAALGEGGVTESKSELTDAVQAQLKEQHLQTLPSLISKIEQLHMCLKGSKCAILSGPSGSGKTMSYSTLAAAYQYIRELRALGKSSKSSKHSNRFENTGQYEEYPITDVTVLNPAVYSYEELFGSYVDHTEEREHQQWRDGILTRIFRHIKSLEAGSTASTEQEVKEGELVTHWIVLDGPVDSRVMEVLASLVSGEGLFLTNGDMLHLPTTCQLLVETTTLNQMAPSLIAHSALLHFSEGVLTRDAVVNTWLDRAPTQHNLSAMSTETLATMIKHLLPDTLEYLHETNTKHLGTAYTQWASSQVCGLTETQCFLNLLSAVLERNSPKVESSVTHTGLGSRSSRLSSRMESRASSAMLTSYSSASMHLERSTVSVMTSKMSLTVDGGEPLDPLADDDLSECNLEAEFGLSLQIQMAAMLSFAYIWSLGAFCPFSELSSFSDFAREMIMQLPYAISLPEEGSVFDYYLNLRQYQFLPWAVRRGGSSGEVSSTGYVSLPELDRYTYITDLHLSYGFNVMIVGQGGTGKSSLVENLLQSRLPITTLQITSALTAAQLQEKFLARLSAIEKRSGHRYSYKQSSKCIFFLDDVHLANSSSVSCDSSMVNTSTVLELTSFVAAHHQLFDYSRDYSHTLNEVRFISSCTPEEFWRLPIKFLRSFNSVPFLPPSDDCLKQIFSNSVLLWLQEFPETSIGEPEMLAEAIGTASVAVLRSLTDKIHPSPSSPHLTFTLHDFMHIYEGLLLLSPSTKTHTQPQFSLLNRRGFLSSSQSSRSSSKKTNAAKQKKNVLPSLNVRTSQSLSKPVLRKRNRGLPLAANLLLSDDQAQLISTMRTVIRLWCHETTRVYLDRVVDSKDRIWFTRLLEVCIKYCFCGDDLRNSTGSSQQRQHAGTASYGGRRVRGSVRGGGVMPQSSFGGLSIEDLSKDGIKVDVLQKLMPPDSTEDGAEGLRKLLTLDQVTMKGENLTGLIFAQFPKVPPSIKEVSDSPRADATPDALTYTELGDGQVMDILKNHIESLKHNTKVDGPETKIVLFTGAIEHASRMCRVMSLVGSHALLIGTRGSGRRTLARLLSHIFRAKLFEVVSGSDETLTAERLDVVLRDVCVSAAVDSQPTVLLATSTDTLGTQGWEKIRLIMETGLCPGLFTTSELLVMSSKLQHGRVKKTTDGARQTFAKAVRKHLHVFILWDVDHRSDSLFTQHSASVAHCMSILPMREAFSSEEQMRSVFATLCQACSYIDHFSSWTKQEYTDIALRWWQQGSTEIGATTVKWQDWIDTSSQLEAVGMLATHIHLTTMELLARIYGSHCSTLLSPKVFIECLCIAQELAMKFKAEEKEVEDRLQLALQKLADVDRTVYELEEEMAVLKPQLALAEQEVQQRMNQITAAKEKYMAANQRCKMAEDTIKYETKNVGQYSKMVEEKFEEVSPVYHAALRALSSVGKNDIMELMGYREPPDLLKPVFDALCMLFDREQTWDDCKLLLLSPNFFENLRFFDKDNIPKRKLKSLEKMIAKHSKFELLGHGSQAVVSLCSWMNALTDYHQAKMAVQPFRESLAEAEKTLQEANRTFVEMRKDMMETKVELEETVKVHKESVQKQRSVEVKIEAIHSKLDHASHLVSAMAKQRHKWEEKLKDTKNKINSLPGHALLCSAAVCYLTRVPPDMHTDLMSAWLGYCNGSVSLGNLVEDRGGLQSAQGYQAHSGQQQVVRIQKDFSVATHLSDKAERSLWEQEGIFPDKTVLDRCLSTRLYYRAGVSSWPLMFDPHGHFMNYLEVIKEHSCKAAPSEVDIPSTEIGEDVGRNSATLQELRDTSVLRLSLGDPQLVERLSKAVVFGHTVVLSVKDPRDNPGNTAFASKVFRRAYFKNETGEFLDPSCAISVNPFFKLFVVVEQALGNVIRVPSHFDSVASLCGRDWSSLFVVDLGLSLNGLQSHLQKLILKYKKPEYSVRYKSLLTDLALHHQQLETNENDIINCVVSSDASLLEVANLLQTVQQSESSDVSTLELIHETKKNIKAFDQQSLAYKSLSEYCSLLFSSTQKLVQYFQYFKFPLSRFERLLGEVLTCSSRDLKVPDNLMAINAHVLHLRHELLSAVCKALRVHLFERHQVLLLLLVGLETMKHQGKLKTEEVDMLGRALLTTEGHIDLVTSEVNTALRRDAIKPQWMKDESWCAVLQLQKSLPSFRRLSTELINHSNEWMEYLQMTPSLMLPIPGYGESCSMGQKLLLWRVLQPSKFPEAARDFILLVFGADFTSTQLCTISTILPHTNPILPTICYSSNISGFSTSLRQTAAECNREVFCKALIDEDHLGTIESLLSDLMQDGHWLVVENLQLCDNPSGIVSSLSKVILEMSETMDVHPEFRIWIPLSLSFCIRADLGRGFAFDGDQGKHSSGNDLLTQDLQAVINLTSTLYGASKASPSNSRKWETHQNLVSKLQNFVPQPLSPTDLVDLDPKHNSSQTILSLIFEEQVATNRLLVSIHSSLEGLSGFLMGRLGFSAHFGATLSSLNNNLIPESWISSLSTENGYPKTLMPALKLLKERHSFQVGILQSGVMPTEFSPLMISKPSDLLSRALYQHATEHHLHPCEVAEQAKLVLRAADAVKPQLLFKDLTLHGATLEGNGHLSAVEGNTPGPCFAVVYFDSKENATGRDCPVILNSTPVFTLSLTSLQEPSVRSNSVYLTCNST